MEIANRDSFRRCFADGYRLSCQGKIDTRPFEKARDLAVITSSPFDYYKKKRRTSSLPRTLCQETTTRNHLWLAHGDYLSRAIVRAPTVAFAVLAVGEIADLELCLRYNDRAAP